ncbi:jupiter microtubule associated homolog 2 [Osmerus eperlanus]|uniref:jupiter microtubule associated homolog 2 n=1 Tax=Osmerus eperlanus TaxID=29151 RepID=UPI002E113E3D
MTSTNMFQGLDGAKPSSRVLRPPGGGSSNLFGGYEEDASASRRPHKMASTIFEPVEDPSGGPRRSNPPGGRSSGIFDEPKAPLQQHRPAPPGGPTSNIFGEAESSVPPATPWSHPNKPKDNINMSSSATPEQEPPTSQPKETPTQVISLPPVKVEQLLSEAEPCAPSRSLQDHEPRLGARPRSHNKVLNPPGGKSSVVFY